MYKYEDEDRNKNKKKKKCVTTVWVAGTGRYSTLNIPVWMAKEHRIDQACSIELISTEAGILIRKYDDE